MQTNTEMHSPHQPVTRIQGVAPLLAIVTLGISSFSILLPLSPAWAIERGANEAAAGSVTTVLMVFTILAQLSMDKAIKRFGWTRVLAFGLLALGVPATLQVLSSSYAALLISSAVRGLGFGILTVGSATAMALLVPASRRGAAVGAYGLAIASPQLLLISSAPVMEQYLGSLAVTLLASAPLLGLFLVRSLGQHIDQCRFPEPAQPESPATQQVSTLRLIAPTLLTLLLVTGSGGALLTFASQIVSDSSSAAIMLLCMTGLATLTRWWFGVLSDRYSVLGMLSGLCAVLLGGMVALAAGLSISSASIAMLALFSGSILLGIAYGGIQSCSLVYAFRLGGPERLSKVAVLWNVTFDLGTGLGALLAGVLATAAGFAFSFTCLAFLTMVGAAMALGLLHRGLSPGAIAQR
ncbi:MFS transporter [Pseudomonas sp. 3A(2025)]